MKKQTIKESINQFLLDRGENERYASFDYCYNYFYLFYKDKRLKELANNKKNLQMSCLQLGFYLASWGMMRASSFLLKKSVKHFSTLIEAISEMDLKLWEIDVNNYSEENIKSLLKCKERIIKKLGKNNAKTWDTLVSKIMLGVFANVPAYDNYFKKFLKDNDCCQTFNENSLEQLSKFYNDEQNTEIFDSFETPTLDFLTGKNTNVIYTKAKLIDMYGFIRGKEIDETEKENKKKK